MPGPRGRRGQLLRCSMTSPARESPRITTATRLKELIEAAEAGGVLREDMVLRLTFGDVSQLKRDASLALEDIRFAGGVMRFLGVKIEQGGVAESILDRPTKPS